MLPRDLLELAVAVALDLLAGLVLHPVTVPVVEEVFEIVQPTVQVHPSARLQHISPKTRIAEGGVVQNIKAAAIHNPIIRLQLALLLENIPTIKASLNINHNCCPNRRRKRLTKSVNPKRRSGGGICGCARLPPARTAAAAAALGRTRTSTR
jgi:hypothetical protein